MPHPIPHASNRRQFLRRTAAGVALFNILPGAALGAERLSANDKINLAAVGIGSRGGADIEEISKEGANIVALCDVDFNYAAKTAAKFPGAKQFGNFREMLDKTSKEIDGVVIGTPDHTHAVIAMAAMKHGKHVYCEKPLAHNIHEVRALMTEARRRKVITQLGNQGHSSDTIRRACEWIWAGAIGQVHTVHAACDAFKNVYCQIDKLDKLNQTYDVPKSLNYDLWVGPAPFRPYTPFWVPWNWRGWTPFGCGTIGDWFCHVVDPSFWALDLDSPTSVRAEVTDYNPATQGLTFPPASQITYEFPAKGSRGPIQLVWYDGNNKLPKPPEFGPDDKLPGTGAIIRGDKGLVVHGSHGAGGCYLLPQTLMDQYSGKNALPEKIKRVKSHAWDWLDAIRNNRAAGSDFGYGGPLTQAALIGVISLKYPGETLKWDDKRMRFTNKPEASAWVNPPYREGWKL